MLSKRARRALLVCVLFTAAGLAGSAHQPSTSTPAWVTSTFGSGRHAPQTPLPGDAMRAAVRVRQSSSNAATTRLANRALERWVEKARGAGGRWEPIDHRPADDDSRDEGDEGGFVDPDQHGPGGTQSELSIAVDSTGQHIVIGMNDFRGFGIDPVSVSGFSYSDDGGATFTDGGQLPVTVPTTARFNQTWPQVFGDPEVKYLGGSTFVYFSIVVTTFGPNGLVQTMGVHRSTDYGHTWTGPYLVTAATNPSGQVDVNGDAVDAADKEYADVDPDTGRVLLSWTNFTASGAEISVAFSDDLGTATSPTWSVRRVIASGPTDGQAAIPRFAGNGSPNVYLSWQRYSGFYTNQIGFSRSTDNGQTWSAAVNLTTAFVTMDQVPGNDRVHNFPGMAVDTSPGAYKGNIYVVYAQNNSLDGADIAFRRSTDGGLTFSAAILLNGRPGADRAQWFPWVSVDRNTGRIYVSYYDQGAAPSGDLTDTTYQYSDDGGVTWQKPRQITDLPFHAGYGNDTSQPNLGDYNQTVAQGGELFIVWAGNPPVVPFTDGQPATQMSVPDVLFKRTPDGTAPLRLGSVSLVDSGGNGIADAGEDVRLTLPLVNAALNPLVAGTITGISGTLSTTTPGVMVVQGASSYPDAAAGGTSTNTTDFIIRLSPGFAPGTRIELALAVSSGDGAKTFRHLLSTGSALSTTLLTENFDGVAQGTLPAGWQAAHGAGANTVPWTTSATVNGGNNAAFHANANDGATATDATRWERLFSPSFTVPAGSDYVVVEFDVKYDTEDDPNLKVLAYDGFFLRITDLTPGRTLRSVLAEAFAEEFVTGPINHYPKHLPRSGNPRYFEDMSVWAGDSGGLRHVRMKLPGMAGSTAQLRFEYTQDSNTTCADLRPGRVCGVLIDNVVVRSVVAAQADLSIGKFGPTSILSGQNATYTLVATNNSTDPTRSVAQQVTVSDTLPAGTTFVSATAPAGWTCQTPAVGGSGVVSCATATMAPGAQASVSLVVNVACSTTDGTTITNTASIAAASPVDPKPSNDAASTTMTVSNPPPAITGLTATPSSLWPPNGRLIPVTVAYAVTDNCGTVTPALTVSSNEPDGRQPQWTIVDAHHLLLRAERSGGGTGRIYTIEVTATNSSGGLSTATTTVVVPHDQGH